MMAWITAVALLFWLVTANESVGYLMLAATALIGIVLFISVPCFWASFRPSMTSFIVFCSWMAALTWIEVVLVFNYGVFIPQFSWLATVFNATLSVIIFGNLVVLRQVGMRFRRSNP